MKRGNPTHCPNCGQPVPVDFDGVYCMTCGADLLTGKGADLSAEEVKAVQQTHAKANDLQFQIYELKSELHQANEMLQASYSLMAKIKRLVGSICTCAAVGAVILCIWFYWTLNAYLNASVLFN